MDKAISLTNLSSASDLVPAGRYHFITIEGPNAAKDQATKRQARSHAVKQALEKKRILQQNSRDNFRVTTSKDRPGRLVSRRTRTEVVAASLFPLSPTALDPFKTLSVDSARLQILLGNYEARQAPEPVFSIAEELEFHNFRSVFRTGMVDPALLNAVMLSLAFSVTGGSIDRECLGYQGQAITHIREKMSSLDEATSESTIGAILLLAGVEARLGMTSQVQLHMGGVQQLLDICRKEGVYLTGGIKRAMFWQDLHCSILAGSSRIFGHTTFAELQWTRDPFSPTFYCLPPGFQTRSHLLTKEFVEVLEDIQALQCIRDIPRFLKGDMMQMAHINNHTASIQSRLVGLKTLSLALECCQLAAYVCSVMLCCKVWCALVIPHHVSSELLRKLQQGKDHPFWDEHPDLLLWILCIGGAFAPPGIVRLGYVTLLRAKMTARFRDLSRSWPGLLGILKKFTWSEKAFLSPVKALWEEVFA